MPQCQFPVFCCFCVFRKATQEIFSDLDETKAEVPIFSNTRWSPKQRRRGAKDQTPPRAARPGPGTCHQGGDLLVHSLMPPLRLYILLNEKTLRGRAIFQKHIASRRRHRPEIERVQKLFPAPCRRGESPPEAFYITMPASGVMCE
jgi:hypothetical protein